MKKVVTPEMMEVVAERFKVLAEPARLLILNALCAGEKTVTELIAVTGLKQANVSKHLQLLYSAGFVGRWKEGLNVYYFLANEDVFTLCDIMCRRLESEMRERQHMIRGEKTRVG